MTAELPAETLRRAAKKIREVANAAEDVQPQPWLAVSRVGREVLADEIHNALWDPDVARATAEVLDDIAADMEISGVDMPGYGWASAAGLAALIVDGSES